MAPPSLLSLAQRACIRNVASIDSIGDLPFEVAEPILREIQQPKQLRRIELNSPHIIGETSELWIKFIRRDVPTQPDFNQAPEDPDDWFDLYDILLSEHLEKEKVANQWLRDQLGGIKAKRDTNIVTGMDTKDMPTMQNAKLGTYADEQRRKEKRIKRAYNALPSQNLSQGSRIKVKSGSDIMRKVRLQARNATAANNSNMMVATTSREEMARRKAVAVNAAKISSQSRVEKQPPVRQKIKVPILVKRAQDNKMERTGRLSSPPLQPSTDQRNSSSPNDDLFGDEQPKQSRQDNTAVQETRKQAALCNHRSLEEQINSTTSSLVKKPSPPPPKMLKRKAPADPFLRPKKKVQV